MLDSKRGIDQQQQQYHDRMNVGEEDELQLQGFTNSLWKTIIIGMAVFASGGLIAILMLLKPAIRIRLTKKRCSLDKAQILVLKVCMRFVYMMKKKIHFFFTISQQDKYGDEFVEQMHVMPNLSYRYFMHKKIKYIWTDEYEHFKKLKGLDQEKCSVLYSQVEGASSTEAAKKLNLFGRNSIDIEVLPIWRLTFNEV